MMNLSFIGSHFLYVQPLVKGYAAVKPLVYLCRTRLTVSRALTGKVGLVCGCRRSLTFSVVEEHSELLFNDIMPRGPGIVSIRDV